MCEFCGKSINDWARWCSDSCAEIAREGDTLTWMCYSCSGTFYASTMAFPPMTSDHHGALAFCSDVCHERQHAKMPKDALSSI